MNTLPSPKAPSGAAKDFLVWLHWTLVILGIVWVGQTGIEAYKVNFVDGYVEHRRLAEANVILEEHFAEVADATNKNKTIRK